VSDLRATPSKATPALRKARCSALCPPPTSSGTAASAADRKKYAKKKKKEEKRKKMPGTQSLTNAPSKSSILLKKRCQALSH
jgi:hypothetical protein